MRWLLVMLLLAGCSRQGVVVYWADQDADRGATGPDGYGLRRTFASRGDAAAFDVPFAVRIAGVERGRATVAFAACDDVGDTGQDPTERRQAVFSLDFSGDLENGSRPAGIECLSDGGIPTVQQALDHACELSERRLVYRLRIPGPAVLTTVLVDGVSAPPYSISPESTGVYFVVALRSSLDVATSGVEHQLAIEQGGAQSVPFQATFGPCIADADQGSVDPDAIVNQRQSLELVDGALVLDDWSGYECLFLDGTATGAYP